MISPLQDLGNLRMHQSALQAALRMQETLTNSSHIRWLAHQDGYSRQLVAQTEDPSSPVQLHSLS